MFFFSPQSPGPALLCWTLTAWGMGGWYLHRFLGYSWEVLRLYAGLIFQRKDSIAVWYSYHPGWGYTWKEELWERERGFFQPPFLSPNSSSVFTGICGPSAVILSPCRFTVGLGYWPAGLAPGFWDGLKCSAPGSVGFGEMGLWPHIGRKAECIFVLCVCVCIEQVLSCSVGMCVKQVLVS